METARSNLSVISARTSVISRNLANAGNEYASRKIVNTTTDYDGQGVRISSIVRASDAALFRNVLGANSDASRQAAVVDALDQLDATVSDPEQDSSPAALVGKLMDSLQEYMAGPGDVIRGQAVIAAAGDVVASLNTSSQAVQGVRLDADSEIAVSVKRINSLLEEYAVVNQQVVDGTHLNSDTTDALDARDRILADLSKEIGIKTLSRGGNDLAIYTDSGVTLFDHTAKTVTFEPTTLFSATEPGNSVIIDGVAVTGTSAMMPIHSGRLKGLTEVRDEIAVTYQTQLDEIARGLITLFAESDQTGSATPLADTTGLFSYSGSPAVPTAGTAIAGLAQQISINPQFDPSVGGDPALLRDGGTWGDEYVYNDPNTTGAVGYTGRLSELLARFDVSTSFDVSAQIGGNATLMNYASTSVGWLQEMRQSASSSKEYSTAVLERATDSLVAVTAVNLDYEMTVMLDLEHSFQATSRLIAAIDAMYASLLQAA